MTSIRLAVAQPPTSRGRRGLLLVPFLLSAWTVGLGGQQIPTRLTLADALRLARRHNPDFLSQENDLGVADWEVRESYASFLPSVSAGGSISYQEPGVQTYGTVNLGSQSTDYYSSGYALSFSWQLDGRTLFAVPSARAARRATEAGVDARRFALESSVTLQYMAALRAGEELEVARRQLARAEQNRGMVLARVESGAVAGSEGKQAEVDRGRAQVSVIRAEQELRNQKLRLMEQIGLPLDGEVELAGEFEVFEPEWTLDELVSESLDGHPSLLAAEAREDASRASLRQARSQYFPSLQLSTGFYGFTNEALNKNVLLARAENSARSAYDNCRLWLTIQEGIGTELPGLDLGDGCGSPMLTEGQKQAVLEANDVFPFDFTKSPLRLTASVSIPVFTGFSRERSVATAAAAAKDAEYARRGEELRIRRAVTEAYNALVTAWEVEGIEARNVELAEARLEATQQRYALGAAPAAAGFGGSTFLELLDAQASLSTAERDHLAAVYDFHQALAQLEEATGRTLTRVGPGGA